MTDYLNPKCKCDYCGYEGRFEIDIFYTDDGSLMCIDCGTDDLRRMINRKVKNG